MFLAAIYYHSQRSVKTPETVLIIDLGYSDFSAQVFMMEEKRIKVLNSVFDENLGCKTIDESIFQHLRNIFQKKTGLDVSSNLRSKNFLYSEIHVCRTLLSDLTEVEMNIENLLEGHSLITVISR